MTDTLFDRWDALSGAIRRMLDSTPDRVTESAARLEREAAHMDAAIRRMATTGGGPPPDACEALVAQIARDAPGIQEGDRRAGWRMHIGKEVAALWPSLPVAVRYAIAKDADATAAREGRE